MKLFVLINISMPEDISSIIWVKVRTKKKTITCKTSKKDIPWDRYKWKNSAIVICIFGPSIQFHSKNVKKYWF